MTRNSFGARSAAARDRLPPRSKGQVGAMPRQTLEHLTPPPQEHQRADARRNVVRIIDVATNLLAENPAASIAEIAAASGLVRATLYRHFPTREDLLRAILRRALAGAGDAIEAAELERGPAPDAIVRLIEGLLEVGNRFRIIVAQPVHDPEAIERATVIGAPIVELVVRGQREGDLRPDLSPQWLAAAIGALATEALRAVERTELTLESAARATSMTLLEPILTTSRPVTQNRRAA